MTYLLCWCLGHDLMHPRQVHDARGQVIRGRLDMECRRCGAVIAGTVDLTPQWSLLARLRRQVPWAREQSRQRRRA